ncbi:Uma2 family endonuclease [Brevibacillus agri]|nr:Uma2 family endonuclease [Brevibacillus agri]MCG5252466.1 Uma2 family endonuclease [Brevibacillus agri]MED1646877.1 Uma2 family endonuclease [Brevibacillus agri]MED1657621.1 Uma2 family endonuclease [Brevibacillus agri]MED1690047.1 Uma2 family endonuclease [Brevibacillus agri]MED1691662.1 Uma2 family endonuclease [Brevibacillus agri]
MSESRLLRAKTFANLLTDLYVYVKENKMGKVLQRTVVFLDNRSTVLVPDILFVANKRTEIIQDNGIYGSPDFIAEIFTGSLINFEKLMMKKKEIYAEVGVKEYWVADPLNDKIIHKHVLRDGAFLEVNDSNLFPNIKLHL